MEGAGRVPAARFQPRFRRSLQRRRRGCHRRCGRPAQPRHRAATPTTASRSWRARSARAARALRAADHQSRRQPSSVRERAVGRALAVASSGSARGARVHAGRSRGSTLLSSRPRPRSRGSRDAASPGRATCSRGELAQFDPAIHMYAEDMDLGIRARLGGVRVAMRPEEPLKGHPLRRGIVCGRLRRSWPGGA